jgi:hypothetical protein
MICRRRVLSTAIVLAATLAAAAPAQVTATSLPKWAMGPFARYGSGGAVTHAGLATTSVASAQPLTISSTALYGAPALAAHSLPGGTRVRPGPSILYAPLPRAPQLENAPGSIWDAPPILVSGSSADREGEFLYQDYLFDDHGAGGNYTYPTGPEYASQDLADFVEIRLKLTPTGTAFRITYNAMTAPDLVATTIAMGSSPSAVAVPYGANATEPATTFITVHGSVADLTDALTGRSLGQVPARIDTVRRQVQVIVPFSAYDPRGQTAVRVAAATGLWNPATSTYLVPGPGAASATTPGGALGPQPTAFFNVAFRYDEVPQGAVVGTFGDAQQDDALLTGNLSQFFATVNFRWLAAGVTNQLAGQPDGTPQTGYMVRIYASQFTDPQGLGQPSNDTPNCTGSCMWQYGGELQPYEIYIPPKPPGPKGYGITIDLHGCGNPYTLEYGDARQEQLAARGTGSIVFTPEARGGCYWYYGQAATSPFEIWDDLAHRYHLNPTNVALTGISMGGYGTYKLAAMFPDLFAAIAPVIPCPSAGTSWIPGETPPGGTDSVLYPTLPSLRNVPVITWMTATDELCVYEGPEHQMALFDELDALGYQYDAYTFAGLEHDSFAGFALSQAQPIADYLGTRTVVRNPADVTYVLNGSWNDPANSLNADHAYWMSGLTLRDPDATPPIGRIDAFSHGLGLEDHTAQPTQRSTGALPAFGGPAQLPYISQSRAWNTATQVPASDQLDITATNIATVTIDARRAGLTCHPHITLHSSTPLKVSFTNCPSASRRCPPATGHVTGATLGLVRLGMTRSQARAAFMRSSDRGKRYEDFFCLTPIGVRVGYASPASLRTLSVGLRPQLRGRVIWASTANQYYSVYHIRPGATLAAARQRLKLAGPFHVGLNDWYLATDGPATAVFKAREGTIQEIGIGDKRLTHGRRAELDFLTSFS